MNAMCFHSTGLDDEKFNTFDICVYISLISVMFCARGDILIFRKLSMGESLSSFAQYN